MSLYLGVRTSRLLICMSSIGGDLLSSILLILIKDGMVLLITMVKLARKILTSISSMLLTSKDFLTLTSVGLV